MHLLIDTKFELPVLLPGLVARLALLEHLDRVLDRRLAVISAPAGFGKTTLLSQWCQSARARGIDIAWLSLGSRENELGRLIDYIIGALARVSDQIVKTLPAIVAAGPNLPLDVIVTRLVNGIASWRRDIVLVIDDVHFLEDPEIGTVLDALLTYAPPNFRMLLATRGSVPVKVATLRMRDLVVRLDETSLRFTLDEAMSFLNESRSLGLNAPDVLTLHNRTEGWIAGLQLASLAVPDTADRSRFLQRFSGATGDIADFLLQDVISHLSAPVLDFLLRTSILDWFDADLAETVSGQAGAAARLTEIEGANLFLVPLNSEKTLFRYHHLFAELLRALLVKKHGQDIMSLHLLAARRLQSRGLSADAVHHALAAGEADMAAALVQDCCMPLIRQSHLTRVHDWLSRLPPEVVEGHVRLLLAKVWIEFQTSRPRSAAASLKKARDSFVDAMRQGILGPEEERALAAEIAVLTAGVFSSAERPHSAARLARARLATIPDNLPFLKGTMGNILGFSLYSSGEFSVAQQACLTARDHHADAQSVFGIAYSDLILGLIEKGAGNLAAANELFARATRMATDSLGSGSYAEAMAGIFRVELLYEWNELDEAEALLSRHRPMIEESGLVVHDIACKLHVARFAAAHGRIDAALAVLEQAERQGRKNRYRRQIATALNDRVRLLVLRGETVLARHVLNVHGINEAWVDTADAGRIACEMEHVAFARLLIAENRPEVALNVLDKLSEKLRREGRFRRLAQVRTLASVAAFRMGDGLATLAAIIDAVDICQRQGAVRTLMDEGEQLREVLRFGREKMPSWQSRSDTSAYVDKIIGAARPMEPQRRTISARPQFSAKETEVVRHLTGGLSNRELAGAMAMAPDTVKWHLKNIFGKLGVHNRTQAVLRLREMGFSSTPERR